jgi:hypothetical protein
MNVIDIDQQLIHYIEVYIGNEKYDYPLHEKVKNETEDVIGMNIYGNVFLEVSEYDTY